MCSEQRTADDVVTQGETGADRSAEGAGVRGLAVFVLGYAIVDLVPVVLPNRVAILGMPLGDATDALLVFLLVYLYVKLAGQAQLLRSRWTRALFAFAIVLVVQGHAIHLTANAIAAVSEPTARGWSLIYFLDEIWGHTELHFAFLLLAALFIRWAAANQPARSLTRAENVGFWVLAIIYGLILAGDAIEGQTAVRLMLPCAVPLCVWGLWPYLTRRYRPAQSPVLPVHRRFFATSLGVTAIALTIYGSVMGGFPQFSGG